MDKRIGIIGLGIMGGAFARHLAAAGWKVIGYDIEPARNAEAKAAGVEIAHSAEAVAEVAADIITSLPKPRAVLDTAEVIARANVKNRTVVETSTLSLADKTAFKDILEKAGHTALDCPMSGTGAQAAVKDLVVFASGDSAAIKRLEPAFLGFARKVYDLGRLRQRQQDEVRRQPPGVDPQRGQCGSHGARHEGRPRPAPDRGGDLLRRRHLARVRAARADDGRAQLPAGHRARDDVRRRMWP